MLRDLARAIDTPAPDYSDRVRRELAGHNRRPGPAIRRAPRRILHTPSRRVLIAAAVLLIAAAVAIAVPGSRRALAQWLGFAGIELRHTGQHPIPPPASPQEPSPEELSPPGIPAQPTAPDEVAAPPAYR